MGLGLSAGLLDTSVLIAAEGADALELPATAAISVITLGELRAGVLLARDDSIGAARRRRLESVRAAFRPLPVDEVVAARYGELLPLARKRSPPGAPAEIIRAWRGTVLYRRS